MPRGRPRGFDRDIALTQAMDVFWRRGYQDTSIADLTERLGINSPSLYAAFGSKSALFREVAERYETAEGARPGREMMAASTARDGVERLLRSNAELFTRRGGPRGCLLTRATLSCPDDDVDVRRYLDESRRSRRALIRSRLARGAEDGEHLPDGDLDALADHYDALVQGMAVQAAEGASRATLQRGIDVAMAGWDALSAARSVRG